MNVILEILQTIWFLIPAGVANMFAGVSAKFWPRMNFPIDLFLKYRGRRIFGEHKTFRGLISGTIGGTIAYILQDFVLHHNPSLSIIVPSNYSENLLLGFLLSFGGLMGDAIKSFIKRQLDINPGRSWFPFDQMDWLVGTMVLSYAFIRFDIEFILYVLFVGILLHMIVKFVGYTLNLQTKQF